MKIAKLIGMLVVGVAIASVGSARAAENCEPSGKMRFVCGPKNVEDLVLIPGTHWIVASGMFAPGHVHLIDADTKTWRVLYPGEAPRQRPDTTTYRDCPGAPDPEKFVAQGMSIRSAAKGFATFYVVNHGGRDSIEVFELDTKGAEPIATWIGCAVLPKGSNPNSVAPLPDGGLVVTSLVDAGKTYAQMFSGENTGEVYEWHPTTGFHMIPGTELAGANGIEVSRDGKQIYVAATGSKTVTRYSLDGGAAPSVAKLDFPPDNIRRSPQGQLLVAGRAPEISCADTASALASQAGRACPHGAEVVAINPATMEVRVVIREKPDKAFTNISSALQVGSGLWLAAFDSDRVAYLAMPSPAR